MGRKKQKRLSDLRIGDHIVAFSYGGYTRYLDDSIVSIDKAIEGYCNLVTRTKRWGREWSEVVPKNAKFIIKE